MKIGRLRNYVKLQTLTEGRDADGGYTRTWGDTAQIWASIKHRKGVEIERQNSMMATATHLITIHYRSGVTTSNRLTYGSRTFGILDVNNVEERNKWMELECIEEV